MSLYLAPADLERFEILSATLANSALSKEGDVNGLWNFILNLYFPASKGYAIKPELKMENRGFCDFIIVREELVGTPPVLTRTPVLLFEGKGPLSQNPRSIFDNVCRYHSQPPNCFSLLIANLIYRFETKSMDMLWEAITKSLPSEPWVV